MKNKKENKNRKMEKCNKFFNEMAKLLEESHTIVGSCNKDLSAYLVPFGTKREISYKGKPANSFRVSDHWNWYANLKKNSDPDYIQCHSVNVPLPRERKEGGKASKNRKACQVAFFGNDGVYRCVYGDYYNRATREWTWVESSPEEVMRQITEKRQRKRQEKMKS